MRQTFTTQKTDTDNMVYDETDTHHSKDWHTLQGLWWDRHSLLKRLTQLTRFMMRQTLTTQKTDTANKVYYAAFSNLSFSLCVNFKFGLFVKR